MIEKKKSFAQIAFTLLLVVTFASFDASAQIEEKPAVPVGLELIDGDILMPKGFLRSLELGLTDATYRTNLWTNGVIPYEFDANVTAANQTNMINAMAVLENVANVDFRQCLGGVCDSGNYVHVQNSTANNSQVGMMGGLQIINMSSWNSQFIIVHELLHCLGFYHEHVRSDRNTYVTINCNPMPQTCNIQGGFGGTLYNNNFVIPGDASVYGAYDFDSLMHYDQCSFSVDCPAGSSCNCTNTVITALAPNQGWQTVMGQRDHLSALDRATVSFLYPQANWRFLDCTYNGSNGASNGTFRQPWTSILTAYLNTPSGGTLWITGNCAPFPTGTYNPPGPPLTIRTAPNITASFGG